jgi:type IV secretory pathway VirB10-like protein
LNFVEKHIALILTSLITGILVLGMFSFSLTNKIELITESYFEIEPQTEEELKELEELKAIEESKTANTNEASNEDEEFKEMMRNFKTMSNAPTHEEQTQEDDALEDASQNNEEVLTSNASSQSSKQYALNDKERERFNKASDVLAMQTGKKPDKNTSNNSNSSVSFSLKNRQKVKLPPPVYLCETGGKIVINITVNSEGHVTDTYINSSSSSSNQCLIDTAIEYAENAIFSNANRKSQIGSITYYFKSK